MFMGEFEHTLDDKGRLTVPSRFREELGERFVMTRGLDRCLFVYSMEEWSVLTSKLKNLPFTRADARAFTRLFFSGATECAPDKQGRVSIPPALRKHGQIEKECVIIGVSNRVEIWGRTAWEAYTSTSGDYFNEIAEKIVDFDL
ncbi:cell division protein MraZ [Aneurinibacillus migulanus]|uniref:division/cell wall cluster transcriptional repressor MraZ n=1 Tax=Aneurinibacillus migulanus TaxID=47500 RepID=UPI0005B9A7DA|nr:division/cell wall cluster transcriptional repressor MraZ [Aneurinibacillus migulanus]KIV50454.1 cell division protein MraZ [Aneurinibacillus migulanus]KPD05085.1 cell division protein MraZ [Aneurinibacillus migulanus]MCP1355714.1 division/cell wall cluster transcriptional repressor MraZ [Aneurinibacillus migulanus]MED4726643.1 division/cell wall cluster transcriptional repressor MraZ [Aneurinibacillus migulanus]